MTWKFLSAWLHGVRPPWLGVFALLTLTQCLAMPAAQSADLEREARIKAAIVFKLVKFVQWPKDRPGVNSSDLVLCTLGGGPVADALRATEGRSVGSRTIRYYDAVSVRSMDQCHVLFLNETEYANLDKILSVTKGSGTLLVSDQKDFAERGGAVGLVVGDNRVRFHINLRAVRDEGLVIPAPVLELADLVNSDGGASKR